MKTTVCPWVNYLMSLSLFPHLYLPKRVVIIK